MVIKRFVTKQYPTEIFPDWEPTSWPMEAKAAERQKFGFIERSKRSILWKNVPWKCFPAEGLFGKDEDWFRSHDVGYIALLEHECLILIQNLYFGFPDPPEWGLASRSNLKGSEKWTHWGYFKTLPKAWMFPVQPKKPVSH